MQGIPIKRQWLFLELDLDTGEELDTVRALIVPEKNTKLELEGGKLYEVTDITHKIGQSERNAPYHSVRLILKRL